MEMRYAKAKKLEMERIQACIEDNRTALVVANAIADLSRYTEFKTYIEAIGKLADRKMRQLIAPASMTAADGTVIPLEWADRRRAEIRAQLDLLNDLFDEPQHAEAKSRERQEAIARLEEQAKELQEKYGHITERVQS